MKNGLLSVFITSATVGPLEAEVSARRHPVKAGRVRASSPAMSKPAVPLLKKRRYARRRAALRKLRDLFVISRQIKFWFS
jgi:hypothetical protein